MSRSQASRIGVGRAIPSRRSVWSDLAVALACVVAVAGGFHFWPLEQSRLWQIAGPLNAPLYVWTAIFPVAMFSRGVRSVLRPALPHVSIVAFIVVSGLSIGASPDAGRTAIFTAKLAITGIAGHVLFAVAARRPGGAKCLVIAVVIGASLSILYCAVSRHLLKRSGYGFFDSAHKFGAFASMAVPFLAGVMLTTGRGWLVGLGGALCAIGLFAVGTVGGVAGVTAGLCVPAIAAERGRRWLPAVGIGATGLVLTLGWTLSPFRDVRSDARLMEDDSVNIRQRYIEWQALINVVEQRATIGVGAGCINEHRSTFYGRLPKLNTLEPFDQNGWLATAAESGLIALACLCWVVGYHVRNAWGTAGARGPRTGPGDRFAIAALSGIVGGAVANSFCDLRYNGLLIVFVLCLALAASASRIGRTASDRRNRKETPAGSQA